MVTPQTQSDIEAPHGAQDGAGAPAVPRDAYATLQIRSTASRTLVEQVYWRLAEHAQRRTGPGVARHLAALNAAYSTLVDADRREAYDAAFGFTPANVHAHGGNGTNGAKKSGLSRLFARTIAAVAPHEPSPYEVLHVADDASQDVIDLAFVVQRLALKDAKLDQTDAMEDLERAYARIATSELRAAFDAGLAPADAAPAPAAPAAAVLPPDVDRPVEAVTIDPVPRDDASERPQARITFLRPRRKPEPEVEAESLPVVAVPAAAFAAQPEVDEHPAIEDVVPPPAAPPEAPLDAGVLDSTAGAHAVPEDAPLPGFMREPEPPIAEPEAVIEAASVAEPEVAAVELEPAAAIAPPTQPEPSPSAADPVVAQAPALAEPLPAQAMPAAPDVQAAATIAATTSRGGLLGRFRGRKQTAEARAQITAAEDDRLLSLREVLASVPAPSRSAAASNATAMTEPEAETSAVPASAYLTFTGGLRNGTRLPLYGDAVTLGTSLSAGIILPDDTGRVAREHARIWRQGESYFFRQLDGFGSLIGGRDLDMPVVVLEDGDEIEIGAHTLRFGTA